MSNPTWTTPVGSTIVGTPASWKKPLTPSSITETPPSKGKHTPASRGLSSTEGASQGPIKPILLNEKGTKRKYRKRKTENGSRNFKKFWKLGTTRGRFVRSLWKVTNNKSDDDDGGDAESQLWEEEGAYKEGHLDREREKSIFKYRFQN